MWVLLSSSAPWLCAGILILPCDWHDGTKILNDTMGGKASKPQAGTATEQPEVVSSPETESEVLLAIDLQST